MNRYLQDWYNYKGMNYKFEKSKGENMNKDLSKRVNKNRRGFKAFGVYAKAEKCLKCEIEKWGCSAHHQCPECVTQYKGVYQ